MKTILAAFFSGLAGSLGLGGGGVLVLYLVLALGMPHEIAHGSLRLSIGEYNTMEEIDHIIKVVPEVVEYLRNMSPVWDELEKGERKHLI